MTFTYKLQGNNQHLSIISQKEISCSNIKALHPQKLSGRSKRFLKKGLNVKEGLKFIVFYSPGNVGFITSLDITINNKQ